ncbi:MAG TPA: NHL repeat-containing protein [Candidatus Rubrimentiphilum sp.]|nr:NHL repeat-containing protein [Candidatus Rubrimentiphilum sp.]
MLRRLYPGLIFGLACAAVFAACSSSYNNGTPYSGGVPGIGPNFVTNTLYVSNTTQNIIELFTPSPAPSATPQYVIGGGNTVLDGPLYLAFDSSKRLYVTNYNAGTQAASVNIYAQFATGNVLPLAAIGGGGSLLAQPHGIALESDGTVVVANTATNGSFSSDILIYTPFTATNSPLFEFLIGGTQTQLNNPNGVAIDSNKNIYVTNRGNGTVTAYPLPTASPTPSGTPTPTPTATPTANPSASPSPTPTPFSNNEAPIVNIGGPATGLIAPTGIALSSTNVIYVADPDNGNPSIRIFAAGSNGNVAPTRVIAGPATLLSNPVDVKLDSAGNIYVTDAGANKLLIFAPNASGNVAPNVAVTLPSGSVAGLALSP